MKPRRRVAPVDTQTRAEDEAREAARVAEDAARKCALDRQRTDCYRADFLQRALNLGVLARELYAVVRDADTIDTRLVSEDLARWEMVLARCVERIADEGGLIEKGGSTEAGTLG